MENRLLALGLMVMMLTGTALLVPSDSSWGDDGFYVIAARNPNIIATDTNTAIGKGAFNATSTGNYNTASGVYALYSNTTGGYNTASGENALAFNTTGYGNTASGALALVSNTTGGYNTASGINALSSNTTGYENTASGLQALYYNTTGNYNTAVGTYALYNSHGSGNTALGEHAGFNGNASDNFTGNNNIYIGDFVRPGSLTESGAIRIGGGNQSQTFLAGVYGVTASGGAAVYINSSGQLGTLPSSRRYKEDIQDMGDASSGLMKLRPVTFHYKAEPRPLQYGLIAEEVAAVYPDLVLCDLKTGQPQTVAYHLVNALLLNEVQKQHRQILEQEKRITSLEEQNKEIAALKDQVRELSALVIQNQEASLRLARLEDRPRR